MKAVFLRAVESSDKAAALRAATSNPGGASGIRHFEVDVARFAAVPRSPFAYWVSEGLLATFASCERLNSGGRLVVSTNPLNDDFRYVRLWWEAVPTALGGTLRSWAKGGVYSPVYHDIVTVIAWDEHRSTYAGFLGTDNRPLERPASVQHFFRPGLTWPRRTQGGLSLRAMPAGSIFADKGPAAFVDNDVTDDLLALLAVMNTRAFRALVDLQMTFGSYEVGVVQRTPMPRLSATDQSVLAGLARRSWLLRRELDTRTEVSHAFVLPALLQVDGNTLAARADVYVEQVRAIEAELLAIQSEIDERCFDLYGIDEADRRAITEGLGGGVDAVGESDVAEAEVDTSVEEGGDAGGSDAAALAAELVSWAVGVAFGRFDVRLATGMRESPVEPEPFDPLPVCSPGIVTGDDGLPIAGSPAGYPVSFPASGILVDDPGDPRDLTAAVHAVFETVFGASADLFWQDAASLLDPRNHDLRAWLGSGLFEHHLKQHSKSRRKAPILWQLGTPSGRYSAWLYAHRLTADSLFELQSDVVAPKLAYEERQLTTLVQDSAGSPSANERREIALQEAFVDELRALLEEVKRVAPLWEPTLEDGVVLVMAPLWRLVPHKPWQRELRTKWAELAAGKYDWAHLAMHLWPERVVPECAADRSLAIAHELENTFWVADEDEKWTARTAVHAEIKRLIAERTSNTVKEALHSGQAIS